MGPRTPRPSGTADGGIRPLVRCRRTRDAGPYEPAVRRGWAAAGRIRRARDAQALGQALHALADQALRSRDDLVGRDDQSPRSPRARRAGRAPPRPQRPSRQADRAHRLRQARDRRHDRPSCRERGKAAVGADLSRAGKAQRVAQEADRGALGRGAAIFVGTSTSTWSLEILACALNLGSDHALLDMIVDQPHCLHEGIHRRRPDEFPALLLEIPRKGKRFRGGRCSLRFCTLLRSGFVTPDEGCKRAFPFDELLSPSRIVDDRFDLAAMADDAFILEQTADVALRETRYPVEIEIMERCAEVLALCEDGAPAQSGLKTLQAQFLEQSLIITDREAPLGIVIAEKLRCGAGPAAA